MTLPANLTAALDQLADAVAFGASEAGSDGNAYLKINPETGKWTFGAEAIEVENGALWGVNPASICNGFSAFDETGRRLGEEMASLGESPILVGDLPVLTDAKWQKQTGFQMVCLSGEDEGEQVLFVTRSKGGFKATDSLYRKLMKQVKDGSDDVMAVVELKSDSYRNKKFNRTIYNPVLSVVRWMKNDPQPAGVAAEEPVVETQEKIEPPRRRRRS